MCSGANTTTDFPSFNDARVGIARRDVIKVLFRVTWAHIRYRQQLLYVNCQVKFCGCKSEKWRIDDGVMLRPWLGTRQFVACTASVHVVSFIEIRDACLTSWGRAVLYATFCYEDGRGYIQYLYSTTYHAQAKGAWKYFINVGPIAMSL